MENRLTHFLSVQQCLLEIAKHDKHPLYVSVLNWMEEILDHLKTQILAEAIKKEP